MCLSVMTSPEFLYTTYHVSPSTRKLKGFGSRWLTPETAVRPNGVVVNPPAFRQDLRFLERVEQLAI